MWKAIKGYEGLYEINENGEARRLAGFWCRKTRPIKPETHVFNHSMRYRLWRDGNKRPKRFLVHRLVYEAFVGPIPKGITINHIDGDRTNNRLGNLELATMREQMIHAYATGLQKRAKGEARGAVAKLTEKDVREIRASYKFRAMTGKTLGKKYGVSPACIWAVIRRDRWNHI